MYMCAMYRHVCSVTVCYTANLLANTFTAYMCNKNTDRIILVQSLVNSPAGKEILLLRGMGGSGAPSNQAA